MDRDDLEEEIGRLLNDKDHTRWTTAVIDTRLDAAEVDVQKWTNAVKATNTYTPTADTAQVTVGSLLIDILDARYQLTDGTLLYSGRGFEPISRWDLDFKWPNWRNMSSGQPQYWTFDASNRQVILTPKPSSAYISSGNLILLEVNTPTTPLSQGSGTSQPWDSNALMVPYHRALVYWVVSECFKDNNTPEARQTARFYRSNDMGNPGEYEREVKLILAKFDVPEPVPAQVLYKPQGGRISGYNLPSKSNPLGWGN